MKYTIYCAILGQKGVFEVNIDSDERVSALRRTIKKEKHRTLHGCDADTLKLYHVNAPVTPDTYEALTASISRSTIEFNKNTELSYPLCKLSTRSFPDDTIHILVDVPEGESFSSRPGRDLIEILLSLTQCIPPIAMLTTLSLWACCRYAQQLQQFADHPTAPFIRLSLSPTTLLSSVICLRRNGHRPGKS